jgi:very-short-patch-repair endonuclease
MALTKPENVDRARVLRKAETAAEIKLWEALRGRRLAGLKFVRQLPVGPYVADFVCREEKLVIEVDGATHSSAEELQHDARRTAFLEGEGFRVLRVWNLDAFKNLDGVCETILHAAGKL